jgi:crotonobetainyl-CoA:carnitine CoA-transferase CaiB-like acyl-CoA transferase
MLTTLTNLRVLEFSHAVLGPSCGLILADMGAELIRIEPPSGDPTRKLKGFGTGYYPFFNRNKKSLALDIKAPAGQKIVHQLLATADILIENFAPGTMERLGFGYDTLAPNYPQLIYCSLKGFLPGPYANRLALDEVVQMMSGLAYMTGPSGQPLRAGASIIDIMGGTYGAIAILAALRERDQTGQGQLVSTALFETAAFIMGHHMAYAAITQEPVPPMPERVSAWAIYRTFTTAEQQQIFIGITSDKQWQRFCELFQRPDWLADERLATNNGRIDQRAWLLPEVAKLIATYPTQQVLKLCEQAGLPFSPIARPEDLFENEQLLASQSLLETTLPDGTETKLPRLPLLLNGTGAELQQNPPQLGEQTSPLLQELGFTPAQIQQLVADGVVAISPCERV